MTFQGKSGTMKHKDQVFKKFKEMKSSVENQVGKKVKKLRTNKN